MRKEKVIVLIDVANSRGADYRRVVEMSLELGVLEGGAHAYADWNRDDPKEELAKSLTALGIEMHHCPSWTNGARGPNGESDYKKIEDSVLEAAIFKTLERQPAIRLYILVGPDADHIPAATAAWLKGKRIVMMFNPKDNSLGHVMKRCPFEFQQLPMLGEESVADDPSNIEKVKKFIREIDALKAKDHPPAFLTKRYFLENLNGFSQGEILDFTNFLLREGALEMYERYDPRYGQIKSALRLNDDHTLVVEAILEDEPDEGKL